jgi:outer membrane protein assembly factor BamD
MNSTIIVRSACIALALFITSCASDPKGGPLKPGQQRTAAQEKVEAEKLYRSAREVLDTGDMTTALQRYDKLSQQFPFSEFATQGDLERIYALYRNYQPDQALSAADKFIREHPRHSGAAYAQYLKGLVNSTRDEGLSGFIGLDTTKEDVGFLRNAFDDFALLVRKYPNSVYVGDARQRMIDLRNRVAQHELHIVRFYVKRGAYIAAAKRAEQVVTQYPGAPASLEALRLLQQSYRSLNLTQQADDAGRLLAALSQRQGENDYPGFGTGDGLTHPYKDKSPVRVVPVSDDRAAIEDTGWMQNMLSIFGDKTPPPTPAPAPTQTAQTAQTPAAAPAPAYVPSAAPAPAADTADEKDAKDVNLADVLKATFGRTNVPPPPNAPLTTEGKTKTVRAADGSVQVVPVGNDSEATQSAAEPAKPTAPKDDSFFGKLGRVLGGDDRNTEDLAPGGRMKASKTPLIKDTAPPPPAPESAPTQVGVVPVTKITPAKPFQDEDLDVPSESENDTWFGKIANFFGVSRKGGNIASGGRVQPNTEPLIKDAPATPPEPATAAPAPAPAEPTQAQTPAAKKTVTRQVKPAKKSGNWFTNLFSIFDTSESEPYTVVIPTQPTPSAAPAAKKALATKNKPAEPTLDDVLTPADKPAQTAPTDPEKPKNKFSIEMEPYEDPPAKK